jgi:hypothetical protein
MAQRLSALRFQIDQGKWGYMEAMQNRTPQTRSLEGNFVRE